MSPKKKSRKKEGVHAWLSVEVTDFNVNSSATINHVLKNPKLPFYREEDLVYEFETQLEISGKCITPDDRENHEFRVTIIGNEPHAGEFSETLKDHQARDEYGSPVYRPYRGGHIPVYEEGPRGFGFVEKVRGENAWSAWLHLGPRLVSDMLVQLTQMDKSYMTLHEYKLDRNRWVIGITLQTTNPEEE